VVSRSEMLGGSVDPRLLIIPKRLSSVKRVVAVMSSKGGVGKTLIATLTALALADRGYSVGLLDLDFTNPSTHIVLGVNPLEHKPLEEEGIVPPTVYGVRYLTIAMFSGDKPLPLRGRSVDNAFFELLSITRWSSLDYLLIDTPPGMGDEHLNLLTYIGDRVEALIVTTPSRLAVKSAERLISILRDGGYRVLGLVVNMSTSGEAVREICGKLGVECLGAIPFDERVERALGDVEAVKKTAVWRHVVEIAETISKRGAQPV